MGKIFTFHNRVYYEDTDAQGLVYYANYLKFAERARTEMLRELGLDQVQLAREHDSLFVVHKLGVTYHAPARFDDHLNWQTSLESRSAATFVLRQLCLRADKLLVECQVTLAVIGHNGRAKRIPQLIVDKLA